ncbi:hypothetical protein NLM33_27810 [Bradyrhizobium sp. CCGUVB1N3]|uniref:hypothetical protein n=1 Tax=Bradyrhizobium sp. CCGUVB1N3 TaxID=2949629 RepID=UPI0020B20566|nr:hypothetical protein [Bradyrhizobium sp. CCGUVB1N3]MCP3474125.1 hypothetical protein [Bradyrhizobium sp. CCGUVB1N3]
MIFTLIAVAAAKTFSRNVAIGADGQVFTADRAINTCEYAYGLVNQGLQAIHRHGLKPNGMCHIEKASLMSAKRVPRNLAPKIRAGA